MNTRPKRGMALMVVLGLVAAMALLATSLSDGLSSQIGVAHTQQDYQQALWYATSAESLALSTLRLRRERRSGGNGGLATTDYPVPLGSIRMTLDDRQVCFNLNALSDPDLALRAQSSMQLMTLLSLAGIARDQADRLLDKLLTRVDVGGTPLPRPRAAEAPDIAPHLLADISELMSIPGIDAALYRRLTPLLCTLPTVAQGLNVNALSPDNGVLLAAMLSPWLSVDQARGVLLRRPEQGWESVSQFYLALPDGIDPQILQNAAPFLRVDSQFFRLHTRVHVNTLSLSMQSFITRSEDGDLRILWHQTGELE